MSAIDDARCPECRSEDHRFCGRCGKCGEFAIFNPPPENRAGDPESECCGVTDVRPYEYEILHPDERWLDD